MNIRTTMLTFVCAAGLMAGSQDPAQAKKAPACTLGPVAFQTFAENTYFYLSGTATFAEMSTKTPAMARGLSRILKEAGMQSFGPVLITQRGVSGDPNKSFDLEVGILVSKGTKPFGEAKVRSLAAFPCATTVVTGDWTGEEAKVGLMNVFKVAGEQGRIPTGEIRELLLFWEEVESKANNMMQFQIGLQ